MIGYSILYIFISTGCFFLSRVPVSDVIAVRFVSVMSLRNLLLKERKRKKHQRFLILRVPSWWTKFFSLFKGYLNTQLAAQGKLIEDQAKLERSASDLKFKGKR